MERIIILHSELKLHYCCWYLMDLGEKYLDLLSENLRRIIGYFKQAEITWNVKADFWNLKNKLEPVMIEYGYLGCLTSKASYYGQQQSTWSSLSKEQSKLSQINYLPLFMLGIMWYLIGLNEIDLSRFFDFDLFWFVLGKSSSIFGDENLLQTTIN